MAWHYTGHHRLYSVVGVHMFDKYATAETRIAFAAMRKRHANARKPFRHHEHEPLVNPDPALDDYDRQSNLERRVQALEIAFTRILNALKPQEKPPEKHTESHPPSTKPNRRTNNASIIIKST